jgi:pilus assembly protein CpaC
MDIKRQSVGSTALLLLVLATALSDNGRVFGQSGTSLISASAVNHEITQSVERLEMLVKSSRILTLQERIPKFQVQNEEVLAATPVSQNQVQIFGKVPGTTQINLWDTEDKLYTIDVTILADAREVEGILSSQLPLASLKVMPLNESAIISGYVTSVDDVDRAVAITEQFYNTVINNIKVVGVQQVLLHTRIMEVSRTKLREMGVDWGTFDPNGFVYSAPGGLASGPATSALGDGLIVSSATAPITNGLRINGGGFESLIAALRQQDLIKLLAEPTVVATHGRPARFTVGGKVPYIVPSGNGAVAIRYEQYGTSVDFLPFVIGPGRIRLEVRPEVSEPDAARGINSNGIQVQAFTQRYVETAVEMQAGQTFAIAGLLQSRTEAITKSTPLLGEIPYLGLLFRRVSEKRNDIELLITVTPELVDAMDPHEVPVGGPGLNSMSPDDCELFLKGHIEVPNLKGNCNVGPSDGYSVLPGDNYVPAHGEVYPQGAIVPSNQPTIVGDGVSIEAPSH